MKRILFLIFSFSQFLVLFTSCSHIDEDERLIYVKPAEVARCVLIEDFTGQNCLNCPKATEMIHQLQEAYGSDTIVAVAIHSGDFGYMRGDRSRPYPLTTDLGDSYFQHWSLSAQPVGMVNRRPASDYADWGTQVFEERKKLSRVTLSTVTQYDNENRSVDIIVTATGVDGTLNGKLQLWLTEDSITSGQRMPDNTWNAQYLHNHVLRDAVNGAWGTDLSILEGEQKEQTFSYTIPEDKDWKPENMHVVAFVYTEQGVEQVTTGKLKIEGIAQL